jgi:hypothetical protein
VKAERKNPSALGETIHTGTLDSWILVLLLGFHLKQHHNSADGGVNNLNGKGPRFALSEAFIA